MIFEMIYQVFFLFCLLKIFINSQIILVQGIQIVEYFWFKGIEEMRKFYVMAKDQNKFLRAYDIKNLS